MKSRIRAYLIYQRYAINLQMVWTPKGWRRKVEMLEYDL